MRLTALLGFLAFLGVMSAMASSIARIELAAFCVQVDDAQWRSDDGSLEWRATVEPAEDRARLRARLDRARDVELHSHGRDGVSAELSGLATGHHFVEARVDRRGGRHDYVTDVITVGPFQRDTERGCDLALALTDDALARLLLPAIEEGVLAGAREEEQLFGPTTFVERSTLAVTDGGLAVELWLSTEDEDRGDLRVEVEVDVTSSADNGVAIGLRSLERAEPGPKLERLARKEGGSKGATLGTGGGAVVGFFVGGPLGSAVGGALGGVAGHEIGEYFGEKEAKKRTREEVFREVVSALDDVGDALRLPSEITILPTLPPLTADIVWCEALELSQESGLRAALRLKLHEDAQTAAARDAAIHRGTTLDVAGAPREGANARVAVSGDFVERLLAEWTVRGGLTQALNEAGLLVAIQNALDARTRWEAVAIEARRAPIISLHEERIDGSIAGFVLTLRDAERDVTRHVSFGGRGNLAVEFDADRGTARLGGHISEVYFGCVDGDVRLTSCFSTAMDPDVLAKQIDGAITRNSDRLPTLDLRGLLAFEGQSAKIPILTHAWIFAAQGVLEMDAKLE